MRLAVRFLMHLLELLTDIPKRFQNWKRVRVAREHLHYIERGHNLKKDESQFAIFAVYPGTSPLNSVLRIVKTLKANKFQVLAVVNNNSHSDGYLDALTKSGCAILVRPNIGADFGAYQAGIRYLNHLNVYEHMTHLILVNDSIYVSRSSEKSISRIASNSNSINCLFLHREGTVHAASMLLKFEEKILKSQNFKTFWDRYFPYSNKRKIILFGEHKLTKVIGSDYFIPYVNPNAKSSGKLIKFSNSEVFQVLTWCRRTSLTSYTFVSEAVKAREFSSVFSYAVFNLHLSNSLGLFLNRTMGVPLKMDLVRAGVVSPLDFLNASRRDGVAKKELEELLKIIEAKGSSATKTLLARISEILRSEPQFPRTPNGKKHPFS